MAGAGEPNFMSVRKAAFLWSGGDELGWWWFWQDPCWSLLTGWGVRPGPFLPAWCLTRILVWTCLVTWNFPQHNFFPLAETRPVLAWRQNPVWSSLVAKKLCQGLSDLSGILLEQKCKQKLRIKGGDQGFFKSSLAYRQLKTPAPWVSRPVLFVFIHFVLDLNREQNPNSSKYFIKEFVLNLIWQARWLFKSSWLETKHKKD